MPYVFNAMISNVTVALLLTLSSFYYTNTIKEDPENILKDVFDPANMPKYKDEED